LTIKRSLDNLNGYTSSPESLFDGGARRGVLFSLTVATIELKS